MKFNEIFEGLPGMTAIVDIFIYGRTREEHDRNLRSVLERAREKGIRFNPEKCTIGSIKYRFSDTLFRIRA